MGDSSAPLLRFTCPRCGTRLRVPAGYAGGRHHCPACRAGLVVPAADQPGVAAETAEAGPAPGENAPADGAPPPSGVPRRYLCPGVTYIPVVCERCQTRMYATEEEVGHDVVCPECGTRATVTRPKLQPGPSRPWQPVQIDEDEYRLCPGVDQPAPGSRAYQRYIPVICPVCSTRMLATEDQVGHEIVCPDCTLPTTVPPPGPVLERRGPAVAGEEDAYQVHEGVDQPPAAVPVIPVLCAVCGTRMYATADQSGQKIACPDCGTRALVPPVPPQAPTHDPMAGAGEEYRLGTPVEAPEVRVGVDYREERPGHGDLPSDRVRWNDRESDDPPPRWTFFSGVFTFPLYHGSLWCLVVLSVTAMPVLAMLAFAIMLSFVATQATWIGSMLLCGVAFVFLLVWIVVAAAYLLAIVRDTANGHDAVVNWPETLFLDWVGDSYFVFSSLAISLLPGLGLSHLLEAAEREAWLCVPGSMILGFPVLLVSMLETNSPVRPISPPVLGSLLRAWWAWGLFYVESTAVLGLGLAVALGLGSVAPVLGLLAGAPTVVGALMVYCRLLGRVVWYGSK